jgi:HEAT repeat protein
VSSHTLAREARERGDLDTLLTMLADTDRVTRLAAVANMGDPRFTEAVPTLLRCLHAADKRLRIGALRALADIADTTVSDEVARVATDDDSFETRIAAMEALVALRDARAARIIGSNIALARPPFKRWFKKWAATRLVELKATDAIGDLKAAARRADPLTRWRMRRAIRDLRRVRRHREHWRSRAGISIRVPPSRVLECSDRRTRERY